RKRREIGFSPPGRLLVVETKLISIDLPATIVINAVPVTRPRSTWNMQSRVSTTGPGSCAVWWQAPHARVRLALARRPVIRKMESAESASGEACRRAAAARAQGTLHDPRPERCWHSAYFFFFLLPASASRSPGVSAALACARLISPLLAA